MIAPPRFPVQLAAHSIRCPVLRRNLGAELPQLRLFGSLLDLLVAVARDKMNFDRKIIHVGDEDLTHRIEGAAALVHAA